MEAIEANKVKAYKLALEYIEHRLGRSLVPMDFIVCSEAISETAEKVVDLLNQGIDVTLDDMIHDTDKTSGGADGPPPK
jgi:hypothetical protein